MHSETQYKCVKCLFDLIMTHSNLVKCGTQSNIVQCYINNAHVDINYTLYFYETMVTWMTHLLIIIFFGTGKSFLSETIYDISFIIFNITHY